jgi:hypothetical protein
LRTELAVAYCTVLIIITFQLYFFFLRVLLRSRIILIAEAEVLSGIRKYQLLNFALYEPKDRGWKPEPHQFSFPEPEPNRNDAAHGNTDPEEKN